MHASAATLQRTTAWLFVVGGSCFAAASFPGISEHVRSEILAWVYVIGAAFFTSAATVQLMSDANANAFARAGSPNRRVRVHLFAAHPESMSWIASAVQWAGTLFFNVDTIRALDTSYTAQEQLLLVWRPEAFGSVCFLVSSVLAYLVRVGDVPMYRGARDRAWWNAGWNLLGSALFGISTVAGYVLDSGDVLNARLMNFTTMLGALCFVIAAARSRP